MNFYPVTDGQTESNAYEPAVQYAQVGSKIYSSDMLRSAVGMTHSLRSDL